MHLSEEERRIYINLTNQERLAAQEDAHAAKVRPCTCRPAQTAWLLSHDDGCRQRGHASAELRTARLPCLQPLL